MKQKSSHAAAAAAIRAELKKHGVPGSVKAHAYSGGDSVTVSLINPTPWIRKQVTSFADGFQYGSFDGMTDSYSYDNFKEDTPQVKYVFVNASYSDDLRQKAYEYLKAYWGYDDFPEKYSDASELRGKQDWISSEVNRVLNGYMDEFHKPTTPFWIKPHIKLAA